MASAPRRAGGVLFTIFVLAMEESRGDGTGSD